MIEFIIGFIVLSVFAHIISINIFNDKLKELENIIRKNAEQVDFYRSLDKISSRNTHASDIKDLQKYLGVRYEDRKLVKAGAK